MENTPTFFDPNKLDSVYRVDYAEVAKQASQLAKTNHLQPAYADRIKTSLVLIDVQNTFCIPGFELFVGGRSGKGAVEDNRRLCEFIYANLETITDITATMDTHRAAQIFHPLFFIDQNGEHPAPYTDIYAADLLAGKWTFNPQLAGRLSVSPNEGQRITIDYAKKLEQKGKYALTIWPYHAMLGGIGHALVSAVEEAAFFHAMARSAVFDIQTKGNNDFTENYSALSPEVVTGLEGRQLGQRDDTIFNKLLACDRMVIAGQAKSHCVAWTIQDLLEQINQQDPSLAKKITLLDDCSSPVVVPGVVDHTEAANNAFGQFEAAGMHIVASTVLTDEWRKA